MRRALVTGSSRGIGRAIALALGRAGWRPLVAYRSEREEAERVATACGGELAPFGADLATPAGCEALFRWALEGGPVHALVNNAGVYAPRPFLEGGDDEVEEHFRAQLETNFFSTLRLTRRFVCAALDAKLDGARVLNVASRVGFRGEPGAAAYAASKAAQLNLTRSLAVELAPHRIGVFGIAPGWAEPALLRPGVGERRAEIEAQIPLGRVATPEDCAAVAAFLLSDEAAYLSGQVVDVNGASYFH